VIPDLAWWGRLFGLLATEAALLVALAAVVARLTSSAQWRRLIWQTAFLAVALVWFLELGGGRGWLARWRPVPAPVRQVTARVIGESTVRAEPVAFEFPAAVPVADLPATPVQPRWWPGAFWLAGLGALWLKALGSRVWLAWRFRAVHEPKVGQAASLPTRADSGRLAACPTLNEAPPAEVAATVARLRTVLDVGPLRLVAWRSLRGPVAFGIFHPTVAVPADFETRFTPVQREAMLAHELAHLANRDPLWLLVAELVCALAWWHPLMWWARRQFRAACESAADEASTLVPGGRVALAEALVNFGRELTAPGGVGVAGSGLKSELARRVKALLAGAPGWKRASAASGWLVRGGAVVVALAWMLAPNALAVARAPLADLAGAVAAAEPPASGRPLPGGARLLFNRLVEQPVGSLGEQEPTSTPIFPPLSPAVAYEVSTARSAAVQHRTLGTYVQLRSSGAEPAIVLPEFEFPGGTLAEAVSQLKIAAKQADPEGLGISVSFFGAPGLETVWIRPGPTLNNADLALVLATLVQSAEPPVESSLEGRAVLFAARSAGYVETNERLSLAAGALKAARIDLEEARSRHAVGAPELAAAESRHEAAQLALQTQAKQSHLATRQFRLSAPDFTRHLRQYLPAGQTNLQYAVRAFCATNGVEFPAVITNVPGPTPPSNQPRIFYDDYTGQLVVRATLENLEHVEAALQRLNLPPADPSKTRAELEARLQETGITLDELRTRYRERHPRVVAAAADYSEADWAVKELTRTESGGAGGQPSPAQTRLPTPESGASPIGTSSSASEDRVGQSRLIATLAQDEKMAGESIDELRRQIAAGQGDPAELAQRLERATALAARISEVAKWAREAQAQLPQANEGTLPSAPATNGPPLFTRQFRVDPDKFAARVLAGFEPAEEVARRMEALPNRSLIASDIGASGSPGILVRAVSKPSQPGFTGRGESAEPNLQEAARAYFRRQGVAFAPPVASAAAPPPESSALFYNPNAGILFVRASIEDLAKVERALDGLERVVRLGDPATTERAALEQGILRLDRESESVSAQLDEVRRQIAAGVGNGADLEKKERRLTEQEAGTRARLYDSKRRLEEVAQSQPRAPQVQLAVFFVEIEERGADDLGLDWLFGQPRTNNPVPVTQFLTNAPGSATALQGDRLRVERLEVAGQWAVLSGEQFGALRQRLEGRSGVDFLSAPQVISLSDRQAQVSVGDVRTLVTGVVATDGSATNDADIRYVTDQVSVGPVVDLFPRAEGDAWRVRVVASLNEFLGYDAPGKTNRVEARTPGKPPMRRDVPLPRLRKRETQAEALAQPGEIIALRGPLAENVVQTKDKVPVLGDVPLLGRLFRRESTQTQRKRLYVFVQPTTVDAQGKVVGPAGAK
jgi:Flp pilus assembly secretin CpaC